MQSVSNRPPKVNGQVICARIRKHNSVKHPTLRWDHRYAPELPQFFIGDVNGYPRLPLHRRDMASRISFSVPIS